MAHQSIKFLITLLIIFETALIVYSGLQKCKLSRSLKKEIASYQDTANKIMNELVRGSFKGKTYNDLAYFSDTFGSRQTGNESLEKAIDFMLQKMNEDGLENVYGEEVNVTHWVRGLESAELILPRRKKLAMLGLGSSVGTPPNGTQAEVIVVHSFDELKARASEIRGKIVVFNQEYVSYDVTTVYRRTGASEVAKLGGVAALIRSITPFSINSPHTGQQDYEENVTQIPAACITVEDAEMLDRMQNQSWKIVVNLTMNAKTLAPVKSRNVIGEIKGSKSPSDVVIVSGHIDSWDVGQGAMDDGGGALISEEAVAVLKYLNLRPRRTLRAILFTAEEVGYLGVDSYFKKHANELSRIKAAFESDVGTNLPFGLDFSGTKEAGCIIREILKLLKPINATTFRQKPNVQPHTDLIYFIDKGIPSLTVNNENSKRYYFHHTEGDTMTVERPHELDLCTAVWAVSSYVVADLSVDLPAKLKL